MVISIPFHLSDMELLAELTRLVAEERGAAAKLIAHLAVLDARRSHVALGYSSLFAYCREALHLAEHEAYNRIEVARAVRAFPELLGLIHDGALTPTSARVLAPALNRENCERLLTAAAYRSKREVEELVAQEQPRPDVPASVRKLPTARCVTSSSPAPPGKAAPSPEEMPLLATALAPTPAAAPRPGLVAALSPGRYEVRFTVSAATYEKLGLARDLLRHAVPDGSVAEIVDRALTVLIDETTRKRFAVVRLPDGPLRYPRAHASPRPR